MARPFPLSWPCLPHEQRLPEQARTRLLTLHVRCGEAEGYLEGGAVQGGATYTLAQIRESYAPGSVRAYLRLPRSLADSELLEGGQTGRALLSSQLDLLLGALDELEREAARSSGQDLLVQQRFLRERFGKGSGNLKG